MYVILSQRQCCSQRPVDQEHQDPPCDLPATDISAEIGHIASPSDTIGSPPPPFSRTCRVHRGLHHAADRGCSACLCSDTCPDIHTSRCAVCRFLCRPDRPQPAAGRALRPHCSAPVLVAIQPKRWTSDILVASLKERLGGRFSLGGKRLCYAQDASLCQGGQGAIDFRICSKVAARSD